MNIGPRLDLRQSQSLVMTPQLQQAIRLLALSNLEVESFIAEELEKNPLLETGGPASDDASPAVAGEAPPEGSGEPAGADQIAGEGEAALDIDVNDENFHQDSASDRGLDGGLGLDGIGGGGGEAGEGPDFDSFAGEGLSLHEHLMAQAGERLSGAELLIAQAIVEQVEETGYFTASLLDLAHRLGAPLREVERSPTATTRQWRG
jgi:RNA polymerase sigma-54 factor